MNMLIVVLDSYRGKFFYNNTGICMIGGAQQLNHC